METAAPLFNKLEKLIALSTDDKKLLASGITQVESIKKGQDIICLGEKPDYVHLLLEGWACRYKYLEQGERSIMSYLIPGDLCDVHIALLDHMDHSIQAITPAKVAYIPRERIDYIIKNNDSLTRALFWTMLIEESTLREWFVNTNKRPADKRLTNLFCEMYMRACAAGINDGNAITFPITQADLADSMGLTQVHTNRVLQKLRKEGLIKLDHQRLTINDWEGMKAFGQFDPVYLHLSEEIIKQE